jgi:hypothetical protein
VLIVAIDALRHPGSRAATAGTISTHASSSPATTSAPSPSPSSSPTPTRRTTAPGAAKLPLVVLNNTTTAGLAQQAQSTFRAGGWTVTSVGNLTNEIISTCAYYDPGVSGAQAAASALRAQFPAIKRIAPKFAGLPSGPIVVVLTSDYTSG